MNDPSRTDYRSLYDKDFIGAWDLEQGDLTVTIKKCTGGTLTAPGGKKSKKPVIYMTHTEKGFALNATNGKTVAAMYGKYVEAWVGKRITLYKSMTRFGADENIECIRVRPNMPDDEAKPATAQAVTAEASLPPGGEASGPAAAATQPSDYITPDQALALEALCMENGIELRRLKLAAKVERISQIKVADHERTLTWINKAIAAKERI